MSEAGVEAGVEADIEAGFEEEVGARDRALLEVAVEAAGRAAAIHRESRLEPDEEWVDKSRSDFVTRVDLEAERAVQETILGRFPDHAVVAEEAETGPGERAGGGDAAPVSWVVDPLDGTSNWLHGYPEYAASVAAEDDEGLRVACVVNSARGERFTAVRGAGARMDGDPIRVSGADDLSLALVGTGFPFKKMDQIDPYMEVFRRVMTSTAGVRRAGAAALDLCSVACGRLDAFWELWLLPWDVAAGALILREAGGVLERLDMEHVTEGGAPAGDPEPLASFAHAEGRGYLAATPELLEEFRALVRGGT